MPRVQYLIEVFLTRIIVQVSLESIAEIDFSTKECVMKESCLLPTYVYGSIYNSTQILLKRGIKWPDLKVNSCHF